MGILGLDTGSIKHPLLFLGPSHFTCCISHNVISMGEMKTTTDTLIWEHKVDFILYELGHFRM